MKKNEPAKAKYTNKSLMDALIQEMAKKGMIPEGLDYIQSVCYGNKTELRNYEFDNASTLDFGGNEGIYIHFAIRGRIDDSREDKTIDLGTAKTLGEDIESMRMMGKLMADFVYTLKMFVNKNIEDFTYCGYNVGITDISGWNYECPNAERALQRANELFSVTGSVRVQNNSTRQIKVWDASTGAPENIDF